MLQQQKNELETLKASLPERFQPFVQQSLEALSDIFALLPAVLAHKNSSKCNIIVNETTGDPLGFVDWAEAKIEPFGLNLCSFQRFLGYAHFEKGWARYGDYQATEEAFWETFCVETGFHDARAIKTIKVVRIVGLLLSAGFTCRLENAEPVPIKDDEDVAYNMRDLWTADKPIDKYWIEDTIWIFNKSASLTSGACILWSM